MKEYKGLVLFPGDTGRVGLSGSLKASRMVMTVTAAAVASGGHCWLVLTGGFPCLNSLNSHHSPMS